MAPPPTSPPRVTFSCHSQVAPRAVGARIPRGGLGGACRGAPVNAGNGPIASVSRVNISSYHYLPPGRGGTDRGPGAEATGRLLRAGSQSEESGNHSYSSSRSHGDRQQAGARTDHSVYNFSRRVLLTVGHPCQQVASSKARPATPNTAYIYETILDSPSSRLRRAHSDVTNTVSGHITNYVTSSLKSSRSSLAPSHSVASSFKSSKSSPTLSHPQGANSPGLRGGQRSWKPRVPGVCLSRGGRGQGTGRFFPPVKLREAWFKDGNSKIRRREDMRTPPFLLELAPEEEAVLGMDSVTPRTSEKSSVSLTDAASSCRSQPPSLTPSVYPHSSHDSECNNITSMPRQGTMVSRGELPWVFRQKVKRNMNNLSKIMASKPLQSIYP